MAEIAQRPFWAEEKTWEKSKLPPIAGSKTVDEISTAVPKFTQVEADHILGEYTHKDGLLLYHFYHRKRKEIFDAAEAEMSHIRGSSASPDQARILQQEVAVKANADMLAHPWWPKFEDILKRVFTEHFKYQPFKTNFYPEVDGWSVAMPDPDSPLALTPERLVAPFALVDTALGQFQG